MFLDIEVNLQIYFLLVDLVYTINGANGWEMERIPTSIYTLLAYLV
jgi:hypothetical protein